MSRFQTVCKVHDVPLGEGKVVPLGRKVVAVFRTDGQFYAIDDVCPHMGASLAGGYVEGDSVTCPWHAWRFRLTDGAWADNPRGQDPRRLLHRPRRRGRRANRVAGG